MVHEFPSTVQANRAAFRAPVFCLASLARHPVPRFHPFLPVDRRRRAAVRMPSGLTRLACAKSVRYTQLSPTVRSGKRSAVLLQAQCRRGSAVG
ncbi:hypothetical protein BCEP4_480035 [Burkholderia cepacia]|nr:hypothetical protein BCEP4_480035 [Burkholderia cepacia]